MGDVAVGLEMEGLVSPRESVTGMLRVIEARTFDDTGTFWTYEGTVSAIDWLGHVFC